MSLFRSLPPDPLMQELARCEGQLADWLSGSQDNARLFARDPIAAMRAAEIDFNRQLFLELEQVTGSIARKIKAA